MLTPELTRLLNHVHRADADATLCDAADTLDALTDGELAVICHAEPGPVVCVYDPVMNEPALRYSSELRRRISEEIDELELHLPDNAAGELGPIIGETPCAEKSRECCSSR